MSSIVLQLQQELISGNCDILSALRKAHIIAVKLKLDDFDKWINNELNGYKAEQDAPNYREVNGVLREHNPYNGWIPVIINNRELEELICKRKMCDSIIVLMELYDSGKDAVLYLPGELLTILQSISGGPMFQQALFVDRCQVKHIIEQVKDTLLQWTLTLEEMGILGEELQFTEQEKTIAKDMPQTINYYYGPTNVINSANNSQILTAENISIEFDYVEAEKNIAELRNKIKSEEIEESAKNDALEMVDEIDTKIKAKKSPNVIKSALVGLKDFLISFGAGVAVAFIQTIM